jgi:hypothetical protein
MSEVCVHERFNPEVPKWAAWRMLHGSVCCSKDRSSASHISYAAS